ncbi:hypothetical protein [Streptomyces sp. NPDC058426]|uniref:hypothetical protein n=1 Tax=Streptomyces sp. NPDC058426 TaxID=3346493 RepID=UPI0036517B55
MTNHPTSGLGDDEDDDQAETEQAHARGDHRLCGNTCPTAMPDELLRNIVLVRSYPGAAGALEELLRRARAEGASASTAQGQGWDRAVYRCGRCGARRTATTEPGYTAVVAAHQHAHALWDRLTPAERLALTEATRIVLGDLRLSAEWLHLVTLHAEQTARKDPTP